MIANGPQVERKTIGGGRQREALDLLFDDEELFGYVVAVLRALMAAETQRWEGLAKPTQ